MELIIEKANLQNATCRKTPPITLEDGQILVKVEKFALTSNNLTYATAGDSLGYWKFYPCRDEKTGMVKDDYGIIPVWGIGTVVATRCELLPSGERFYGFLPTTSYCVMTPTKINRESFVDGAPHRAELPPVYSTFNRCATDPFYTKSTEEFMCLNRPLYITSWVLNDFLGDNDFFGARAVIISSASSKTSFGLAWELKASKRGKKVIGLTSKKNVPFVESLGTYDEVVPYPEVKNLNGMEPAVFVDMAGNRTVLEQVHSIFGENLKYSSLVGMTHWDKGGMPENLDGPNPVFFFAPSQLSKRAREWGNEQLGVKIAQAWQGYMRKAVDNGWCEITPVYGASKVKETYDLFLNGNVDPKSGFICSFWEESKM